MIKSGVISIIVPIYKVENYLSKCIDSILNQTYENLEIILVDDGSPDNCGNICDEYEKKDSRIKVIHKKNGGLSDARNKGLEVANGEYIMFVDSDDYIESNMVDVMYKRIVEDNSDMAICRFVHINENYDIIRDFKDKPPYNDLIVSSRDMLKWFSTENILFFIIACCKLYKRELWFDIKFPVGKLNEDEFVTHEIIGRCNLISFVNKPLYYYLQHCGSITNSNISDLRILDAVEAFINRTDFYFNRKMLCEGALTFRMTTEEFCVRKKRINEDIYSKNRVKILLRRCRIIYMKKVVTLLKNLPIKSFIYVSLFILNPNLLDYVIKLICKKDLNF